MDLLPPLERGKLDDDDNYTGVFISSIDDLDLIELPEEKLWFAPLLDVMKSHSATLEILGLPYLSPEEQLRCCINSINKCKKDIARWGGSSRRWWNQLFLHISGADKWASVNDSDYKSSIPVELVRVIEQGSKLVNNQIIQKDLGSREPYEVYKKLPKEMHKPCKWWVIQKQEIYIDFLQKCVHALEDYLHEIEDMYDYYTPPQDIDEWISKISEIRRNKEMI